MYEPISHTILNGILDQLEPEFRKHELRFFYSRLGANFYAIYSLFDHLYGSRHDFHEQIHRLVDVMARAYIHRARELKLEDRTREADHNWFLHQQWVGMALYADGFARDLRGLEAHIDYFSELGVNLVHILPILECPEGKSDGGYAVSNFRKVDQRVGSNEDLQQVIDALHERNSLAVLDVVVNHTSDEHEWAARAAQGEKAYQDFYYMFETRDIPDMFERTMPEVFPETDPGNFTWNESLNRWVMTVFHSYQWDLNYTNPAVFIEMLDVIFYWANKGADVLRLDAPAFLWKKMGTASQNEREAHLVLQLFKDCCQVVAPGTLFIAEAIVAPTEIVKYFGEDAVVARECDIAYNATFMALLWDAAATKNARLLNRGLRSLPGKLEQATWLNYLRCHDDIGFGFDDHDIAAVGYDPQAHRRFLVDYFTGVSTDSSARGRPFARNEKTGDARISGSLASLIGLQAGIENNDESLIDSCCQHIDLLNSLILSFGGIPLLYYGDELGTLNDYSYELDERKSRDSRWLHRPRIDWRSAEQRHLKGTIENRIFSSLQRMIAVRKDTSAFADYNTRDLLDLPGDSLLGYVRFNYENPADKVLVLANFASGSRRLPLGELSFLANIDAGNVVDLWSERPPTVVADELVFAGYQFYWLVVA